MLVIDTNVALAACTGAVRFAELGDDDLAAPPLLLSEFTNALSEACFRGDLTATLASTALQALRDTPIRFESPDGLYEDPLAMARRLGWAKSYDAEFLTLALRLGCKLVTLDLRLLRGASHLGFVVAPADLMR